MSEEVKRLINEEEQQIAELKAEIKSLQNSKDVLASLSCGDGEEGEKAEQEIRNLKKSLKTLKMEYEETIWERVEIERENEKLESTRKLLERTIQESKGAQMMTAKLQEKLQFAKSGLEQKIKERIRAESLKKQLEDELKTIRDQFFELQVISYEHSTSTTHCIEMLQKEVKYYQRKAQIYVTLEDSLLSLRDEVEELKETIAREQKSLTHLLFLQHLEQTELQRRLEIERKGKLELQEKITRTTEYYTNMWGDVIKIKHRVNKLVDEMVASNRSSYVEEYGEIKQILLLLKSIMDMIGTMQFSISPLYFNLSDEEKEKFQIIRTEYENEKRLELPSIMKTISLQREIRVLQTQIIQEHMLFNTFRQRCNSEMNTFKSLILQFKKKPKTTPPSSSSSSPFHNNNNSNNNNNNATPLSSLATAKNVSSHSIGSNITISNNTSDSVFNSLDESNSLKKSFSQK